MFLSFRFNINVLVRRGLLYPALRMLNFVLKHAKNGCRSEDFYCSETILYAIIVVDTCHCTFVESLECLTPSVSHSVVSSSFPPHGL